MEKTTETYIEWLYFYQISKEKGPYSISLSVRLSNINGKYYFYTSNTVAWFDL